MSTRDLKYYRFATPEQWARCILHRFDPEKNGGLASTVRLGLRPILVPGSGPGSITAVAVDRQATPLWRVSSSPQIPDGPGLFRLDDFGSVSGPFEIDRTLAGSPRWVVDRTWLWGFEREAAIIRRYERETLQHESTVDLHELSDAMEGAGLSTIVDLAGDGDDGIWVLAGLVDGKYALIHLDCRGTAADYRPLGCATNEPVQLGSVHRGKQLIVLGDGGRRLLFIDASDGSVARIVPIEDLGRCWSVTCLATDMRNRIALLVESAASSQKKWALFTLDGDGDLLDNPLTGSEKDLPSALVGSPRDLAVARDALWLATADGLWRLDATEQCGAREAESTVLTPALTSPESDSARGWLRAEIMMTLPSGAVLEAQSASTNKESVKDSAALIGSDRSLSSQSKQKQIWELLDPRSTYRIVGPHATGVPISIPLSGSQDRWLWLRLTIVTPPGATSSPLTELRVLYPNVSLTRYLPAIFRADESDSDSLMRRLVGVLESTTQGIDERIRSIGSYIDPDTAPIDWLDYLARWLDLPWDDGLPIAMKRALLKSAGDLLDLRGTRRGLRQLLTCLLRPNGSARIVDVTVDHPPIRLGGGGRAGSALPALLAGAPRSAAILGSKAILGSAKLSCSADDGDPLRAIVPALIIEVSADRATQQTLRQVLPSILEQYIPAGLAVTLRWRTKPAALSAVDACEGYVLDARGPGALGEDSLLGRVTVAGRGASRIDDVGVNIGFRLG